MKLVQQSAVLEMCVSMGRNNAFWFREQSRSFKSWDGLQQFELPWFIDCWFHFFLSLTFLLLFIPSLKVNLSEFNNTPTRTCHPHYPPDIM